MPFREFDRAIDDECDVVDILSVDWQGVENLTCRNVNNSIVLSVISGNDSLIEGVGVSLLGPKLVTIRDRPEVNYAVQGNDLLAKIVQNRYKCYYVKLFHIYY